MGLVDTTPVRREVPGDDGAWIEFRALSAKQLRDAARTRSLDSAELLRAFGGDIMRAMRESNVAQGDVNVALADPINSYDFDALLRKSIVRWSYDVDVKIGIGQLDEPTERWALEQIAEISGITRESEDAKALAS